MSALPHDQTGTDTATADPELEEPRQYEVLLLNDDYTTMDFVVEVLRRFFRKSASQAERLTREVHQRGCAVVAIYPREIAETKVEQVVSYAREHEHPLMCTMRLH